MNLSISFIYINAFIFLARKIVLRLFVVVSLCSEKVHQKLCSIEARLGGFSAKLTKLQQKTEIVPFESSSEISALPLKNTQEVAIYAERLADVAERAKLMQKLVSIGGSDTNDFIKRSMHAVMSISTMALYNRGGKNGKYRYPVILESVIYREFQCLVCIFVSTINQR